MDANLLIFLVSLSLGSIMSLLFAFKYILDSQRIVSDFYEKTLVEYQKQLASKVAEFEEVTRLASKANTSLGDKVSDFDKKLIEIQDRLSMLRMQR